MEEVCPHFLSPYFYEKEIAKIRNNTSKKKQNNIAGFCKKVLVPSFAGAVYAMSQMTVTAFVAGVILAGISSVLTFLGF